MSVLTSIWHFLSFFMTAFQAMKNLLNAKNHVFKAENIQDNLSSQASPSMPTPDEQLPSFSATANSTLEYCRAIRDFSKTFLYTHTAIEQVVQSCGPEQYIPGVYFCRYLYPVAVTLATIETGYQIGSYLTSKQKPY